MAVRIRIGELLLANNALTSEKLDDALKAQLIYGGRLGTNLLELGLIQENELARVLSSQLKLPKVGLEDLESVPREVLDLLSPELAERFEAIPFRLETRKLHVAMVDPSNVEAIDQLRFATGIQVVPHIATEVVIVHCLERHYQKLRPQRYIRLPDDPMFARPAKPPAAPLRHAPAPLEATPEQGALLDPPAPTSLAGCVRAFLRAREVQEIYEAVLLFSRPYFAKAGIFSLQDGHYRPVLVGAPQSVRALMARLKLRAGPQSPLSPAHSLHRCHAGPLPMGVDTDAFLTAFEIDRTAPVFMVPVLNRPQEELILVGADFSAAFDHQQMRIFLTLAEKAGLAVDMLRLRNRLQILPQVLV